MLSDILIPALVTLAKFVSAAVIVQFILSLLLSFNVVSIHNRFVSALWQALSAILDPILEPIRKRMPDTGMIDLSPMILLLAIQILVKILMASGGLNT